ncbi:MAG: hypothetical protein WCO52_02225 [bacterium]
MARNKSESYKFRPTGGRREFGPGHFTHFISLDIPLDGSDQSPIEQVTSIIEACLAALEEGDWPYYMPSEPSLQAQLKGADSLGMKVGQWYRQLEKGSCYPRVCVGAQSLSLAGTSQQGYVAARLKVAVFTNLRCISEQKTHTTLAERTGKKLQRKYRELFAR